MKKKILILSMAYYPKHIGGAEVAIKEITDRLLSEDYEFHLVCNRYDSTLPKEEKIGNVNVYRIGIAMKNPSMTDLRKLPLHLNKIIFQWLAYYKAIELHRKLGFNIIWAMMAHATGVPASKFKSRFKEVAFVLTLQEGDPPEVIEKKMRIFEPHFTRAFTSADVIQVISNFLGLWAVQKGAKNKPILVPNAVNTAYFSKPISSEILNEKRKELGLTEKNIALVTTSRLVKKNSLDTVIHALPFLSEEVVFVIFGIGPEEENLKAECARLGVSSRVIFKGQISHEVMPTYLKACDIFIRPSRSEGMGNSFIEAMAAGLPIIGTPVGGIPDFLIDKQTGFMVEVDNPKSIAEVVKKIVANESLRINVCNKAKEVASLHYDWNLIANRMKKEVF